MTPILGGREGLDCLLQTRIQVFRALFMLDGV